MSNAWSERVEDRVPTKEFVDFEKEPGKVQLSCHSTNVAECLRRSTFADLVDAWGEVLPGSVGSNLTLAIAVERVVNGSPWKAQCSQWL